MRRSFVLLMAFSALLVTRGSALAEWGSLTGQFILDGPVPVPKKILVTKDQQVCGKFDLVEEAIKVNPENNGVEGIVIYIYVGRGKKAPTPHPDYAKTATAQVVMDNQFCRFEPNVALLRTTQTLVVGNKDPIGHNTKIDTIKNRGENPIIPAGGSEQFQFPKENSF